MQICFQETASAATREDEQAVSQVKLGPFTPKIYLQMSCGADQSDALGPD